MGRKPNQLILEFFERGQKLEDASNRYQHTCKSCGEKFPKGRIDSLTTHLRKKCPEISPEDRHRAKMQLDEMPEASMEGSSIDGGRGSLGRKGSARSGMGKGQTVDLPVGQRNWTALEALAEVSRQVDLNEHPREGAPGTEGPVGSRAGSVAAPVASDKAGAAGAAKRRSERASSVVPRAQIEATARAAAASGLLCHKLRGELAVSDVSTIGVTDPDLLAMSSATSALPPIQLSNFVCDSPSTSPHLPALSLPDSVIDPALQTTMVSSITAQQIAGEVQNVLSQPGQTLEPEISTATPPKASLSDKFFHQPMSGLRPASTWPYLQSSGSATGADLLAYFEADSSRDLPLSNSSGMVNAGLAVRAATFPCAIAMHPDASARDATSEYLAANRAMRPKVRGKFTASRRREVQEVRKRGACIRCRMLKKPCSGASPCSTCRSVESARLWKQPCIRTRIADELDIYSAGLYNVLAHHALTHARSNFSFPPTPVLLVSATHLAACSTSLPCRALQSQASDSCSIAGSPQPVYILESPNTTTSTAGTASNAPLPSSPFPTTTTLQTYVLTLLPHISALEPPSSFLSHTLALASTLSSTKSDTLLTRVLELWAATTLLVSPSLPISLTISSAKEGSNEADEAGASTNNDPDLPIPTNSESHRLIHTQLCSHLEHRSAILSRSILHELERRLLQRGQSGWFETFLVAVILLNAVERTSWAFASWETVSAIDPALTSDISNISNHPDPVIDSPPHAPSPPTRSWPLEKRPEWYVDRSERFAEMLGVLLRMRGLPPKSITTGGSSSTASRALLGDGKPDEMGEDEMARAYLDGVSRGVAGGDFMGGRRAGGIGDSDGGTAPTRTAAMVMMTTTTTPTAMMMMRTEDMRDGEGLFVAKLLS